MIAGHETVSNTLCFSLMELANHPEIQKKLRDEIRETRAARGNVELTVEDFDRMPHLSAFIKVCAITTGLEFPFSIIFNSDSE
jgi:cytochrome P450